MNLFSHSLIVDSASFRVLATYSTFGAKPTPLIIPWNNTTRRFNRWSFAESKICVPCFPQRAR